jgi:hypothetical protein
MGDAGVADAGAPKLAARKAVVRLADVPIRLHGKMSGHIRADLADDVRAKLDAILVDAGAL